MRRQDGSNLIIALFVRCCQSICHVPTHKCKPSEYCDAWAHISSSSQQELDADLAKAFKQLTGQDPSCDNALVALGKYGFKCDDDLSGLFGVDFKLNDYCCASCNPKPSCKAKCGIEEYKGDGNCDDENK